LDKFTWLSDLSYRVLIDHLQDGIFVVEDRILVYVNQCLADMTGYPVSDLIGRPFHELIYIEDQTFIQERYRARLSGENVPEQYDIRLSTAAGSVIYCSVSIGLSKNQQGHTLTIGSIRDVTRQKAAQAELEASKAELKSILDQLPDVFYRTDMQGIITMISPSCFDVLGYRQEEMLGSNLADYYETPQARQKIVQAIADGGGKATQVETGLRHKDGTIIWISTNAYIRFGNDGLPSYVEGIARDISERIKAEKQLLKSVRQLEEKELAKTRFLAAAGHDLRQPVAAANLFVDALKFTSPTPEQGILIEKLDQSMNIFSGLLERLLDISKLDAGLIKPNLSSFNLMELINWLEQNFAQTAHDKQLNFRFFFPMNTAMIVHTDIGLLQSVMMNLVSNAIKFTRQGGILISARPRDGRVLLQVWDTGIGIDKEYISHIFEEFYQVGNPQRNRADGLGLGLSICQRSMALLEGEVICHSRPGKGSVFEISLPLSHGSKEINRTGNLSPVSDTPSEQLMNGKRFVVVEDDVLVAGGLRSLLQGLGAEITHFSNAEEALRYEGLALTDFFIVDYALGGELSGLDFLKSVQRKQNKPVRAVICTGETSSQFIASIAQSSWTVLFKPINYAKLSASLKLISGSSALALD
jgi:PAS domain S-box-containing protein